jgi:hypothetical protein
MIAAGAVVARGSFLLMLAVCFPPVSRSNANCSATEVTTHKVTANKMFENSGSAIQEKNAAKLNDVFVSKNR